MKKIFLILLFICLANTANAATRFWVGGTGTWDSSTTTHWAATTGGAGGQSVPGSADTATFDASSGGGTVTVNFGGLITLQSLTVGAFTGTLDFSANNNSVTLTTATGFSNNSTGTRTINLGNGTWTLTTTSANATPWLVNTTGLTQNANNSTIVYNGVSVNQLNFSGGAGLTYHNLTIGPNASLGSIAIIANNTFSTITISSPAVLILPNGTTTTATSLVSVGTTGNENLIISNDKNTVATLSIASGTQSFTWTAFRSITATGGATFTASNSFDLGQNTGINISSGGSGGCIIGGWLLWHDLTPLQHNNFPAFLDEAA